MKVSSRKPTSGLTYLRRNLRDAVLVGPSNPQRLKENIIIREQ